MYAFISLEHAFKHIYFFSVVTHIFYLKVEV